MYKRLTYILCFIIVPIRFTFTVEINIYYQTMTMLSVTKGKHSNLYYIRLGEAITILTSVKSCPATKITKQVETSFQIQIPEVLMTSENNS